MNILISGASGAMGKVLANIVNETDDLTVVAGFADTPAENSPFPVYTDLNEVEEGVDVVIDFSQPGALDGLLAFGKEKQIPLVIATTGYSDEQETQIEEAAKALPILHAKNMSLGVNVMEIIAEELAGLLPNFDIEIVEKHHRLKKDAPSGTAKMLFDAINNGRENSLNALVGRSGSYDNRPDEEVGISSIRAGTIVGDHSVIYAGANEVIELNHQAESKGVFASGSVTAARFLVKKENGLYNMHDVLRG